MLFANLYIYSDFLLDIYRCHRLLLLLFNFVVLTYSLFICFQIISITTFLCTICIIILLFQLSHSNQLLYSKKVKFESFFNYHTQILCSTVETDKILGKLVFSLIIINAPCSALVIMLIIDGRIPTLFLPLFVSLLLSQFLAIFGIHLVSSMICKKIHKSTNQLIYLNVSQPWSLQIHLKLAHYISKFNTVNPYGYTYNSIKIITLDDFVKVTLTQIGLLKINKQMFFSVFIFLLSIAALCISVVALFLYLK